MCRGRWEVAIREEGGAHNSLLLSNQNLSLPLFLSIPQLFFSHEPFSLIKKYKH